MPCQVDWLYLEFDDFAKHVAGASPATHTTPQSDAPSGDWRFTEATALSGLVELRLHPPRVANQVADSHYVDAL